MRVFPDTIQNLDLSGAARKCISTLKGRLSDDYTCIIGVNVTGTPGDNHIALFSKYGLILVRFWESINFSDPIFRVSIPALHTDADDKFRSRLLTHSVLKTKHNDLIFPYRIIYIFPDVETLETEDMYLREYWNKNFRSVGFLVDLRKDAEDLLRKELLGCEEYKNLPADGLTQEVIDVIINRIAPWCTIPKLPGNYADLVVEAGLNPEKMEVLKNDSIVEILRLEPQQVNTVNAIQKGRQLILACAGSGKSVIMIARCFKLASLDRHKDYLITCYNKNLHSYYSWQIDEAGFNARNVVCERFYSLCFRLLNENKIKAPGRLNGMSEDQYYESVFQTAYTALMSGKLKTRYYGIFIDEVQNFKPLWYEFVYKLLVNSETEDHIFVICGDITQDVRKNVKNGKAPWQGEGLPSYKGRTIHIEKNYRNSIQINDFINEYAAVARMRLGALDDASLDTFLRGKAFKPGSDPVLIEFNEMSAISEANAIIASIKEIYKKNNIGYTDIAVLLSQQSFKPPNKKQGYSVLNVLQAKLKQENIPFNLLAWRTEYIRGDYQSRRGVSIITYVGSLGIDYRGVIVANVSAVGQRSGVSNEDENSIMAESDEIKEEYVGGFKELYTALTRAKDVLYVVLPKKNTYHTTFTDTISESFDRYRLNIQNG